MKIYKVGGAVRDSLLGIKATDTDWVVVGSSPDEMISKGFKPIGKNFPVFLHPETNEEYALARTEKKSGTGYKGFTFYYGDDVTLEDDLSRRDFTINAMAQDESGHIIDPFGGQNDLKNKLFKHVTEAFYEDPLRAIRLARFYTYDHLKDFDLDESSRNCIVEIVNSGEIADLSPDRVWAETMRAINSSNPNNYFEKIISFNLKKPYFSNLEIYQCDTHKNYLVRWSELQINNNFSLGKNLPIPNEYKNASSLLENLSKISKTDDENIINIAKKINFTRDSNLITMLCTLPNIAANKNFILKLVNELQNTDFSKLSQYSNEKIEEEKTKIYKTIINKCK